MLLVANRLSDISFGKLMEVYEEGNLEKAKSIYGNLDINAAIIQVEQDFYGYLRDVFFKTPGAYYLIWEEHGKYISALRLEPFEDGLLLEALETRPDSRGKGNGKRLVCLASDRSTVPVYSHVNKNNTASLRTHEVCGFKRVYEWARLIDGTFAPYCCTFLYSKVIAKNS